MIYPNCMKCYYGGSAVINKCLASCHCKENENRFENPAPRWSGEQYQVKTKNTEFDIDCKLFIPEAVNIEASPVTTFRIDFICPHCGNEQTLDDVSGEGKEIVECDECGKSVGLYWSIY